MSDLLVWFSIKSKRENGKSYYAEKSFSTEKQYSID